MPQLRDINVKTFPGLVTRIEEQSIPRGSASDSLNWVTEGDHIELRGGMALMGTENAGTGRVTGLKSARLFSGTEVLFWAHTRKLLYYNETTDDNVEIGSNVLPAAASGEDIAMDDYHSLAGAFLYVSSPNSSIYKIAVANPGDYTDLASTNHKGKIRIKPGRMFLWDRKDTNGGSDKNGLYGSYIDKDELSDYTSVSAESIGSSGSTAYSGTLAFKAGNSKRTCMYVSIQATVAAGTEIFRDNRDGTLTSNFGGTGTINYTTGAYSVTFSDTTTGAVTSDYYHEDATSTGIADFSKSTPRSAGQGFVFRQDDGGAAFQNVGLIGSSEYCFHTHKLYKLTIGLDDTNATNLPYLENVGIPYWRGMFETGRGLLYIDVINEGEPFLRIIEDNIYSDKVIPRSLSDKLDLSDYVFDEGVVTEWGVYDIIVGRKSGETANATMFMHNRQWDSWDRHSFRVSCLEKYNNTLVAGDSASNNLFTLFSGFTDEEANIPNYWVSNKDNLGAEGVKYANIFVIAGLIARDQKLKVEISLDGGNWVEVGETDDGSGNHTYAIEGDGSYVDQGVSVAIGGSTTGTTEIGGGTSGVNASPYRRELRINTERFEFIKIRFTAVEVGYVSVSEYGFRDIRHKGRSLPPRYVG